MGGTVPLGPKLRVWRHAPPSHLRFGLPGLVTQRGSVLTLAALHSLHDPHMSTRDTCGVVCVGALPAHHPISTIHMDTKSKMRTWLAG